MPVKRGSKDPATKSSKSQKRARAVAVEEKAELPNGTHADESDDNASVKPTESLVHSDRAELQEDLQPAKRRKYGSRELDLPEIPSLYAQAGRVFVCGQGDSGQLGLGNMNDDDDMGEVAKPRPSPVSDLDPNVIQVAAGGMHSVALTEDGQVFTTGVNDEAALGRKTDTAIYRDVAGEAEDAFRWGIVKIPTDRGKVIQVSAGDSHTAALTSLGAVYSWGVFRGNSGPYAFQPGQDFALEPTLVYRPQSAQAQILEISSGADHILAKRRDGSVLTWGFGEQGQLGRLGTRMRNPEETMLQPGLVPLHKVQGLRSRSSKAEHIAAGTFGSFVITTSGHTIAFGVNASGQLGFTATDTKVEDNLIPRPRLVSSLEGKEIVSISAGKAHTLALALDGRVYSFGLQTYGRLGRGDADCTSDKPLGPGIVPLPDDCKGTSITAGADTSAIIAGEDGAFVFGLGTNKQLTKVSDDDAELPWKVKLDKFITKEPVRRVHQVAMGGQHTLLLVS